MQRDANLSKVLFYNFVGHYNFISTCRQLSVKGAANQKMDSAVKFIHTLKPNRLYSSNITFENIISTIIK